MGELACQTARVDIDDLPSYEELRYGEHGPPWPQVVGNAADEVQGLLRETPALFMPYIQNALSTTLRRRLSTSPDASWDDKRIAAESPNLPPLDIDPIRNQPTFALQKVRGFERRPRFLHTR